MDKKGFELTISTFVLIVLGVMLLIGAVIFLRRGFDFFDESTRPFLESTEALAVKEACELSCTASNRLGFCCGNYTVRNEDIKCTDSRLEVSCSSLSCDGFVC